MTGRVLTGSTIDPPVASGLLADLGFLASPDLPDRPGPAYLLVALRAAPTLRHYDPEAVEYWVTADDRGARRTLSRDTRMPVESDFSWGLIRIVDRLHVTNEYLTFGGSLRAASVDDAVIASFTSPAPLLRRGGHSQAIDPGADAVGAFFGRLLLAVDYVPGFEAAVARADPIVRYAAFVADAMERFRPCVARDAAPDLARLVLSEARRLRDEAPDASAAGLALRGRLVAPGPGATSRLASSSATA